MSDLKIFNIAKWLLCGKTINRAMLNVKVSSLQSLNGVILDLGGGSGSSYKDLLKISGTFISMDAIAEANPTVVGDLEGIHPFVDEYADTIILFNTLEHIFGYQHVVSEMYRVLKKGGRSLVYIPFMFPVHTHQAENFFINDYFRYTRSSLEKIFSTAGFQRIEIVPFGGLFVVIAELLGFVFKFRLLRVFLAIVCLLLEKLYRFIRPGVSAESFPLGYFIVATK